MGEEIKKKLKMVYKLTFRVDVGYQVCVHFVGRRNQNKVQESLHKI